MSHYKYLAALAWRRDENTFVFREATVESKTPLNKEDIERLCLQRVCVTIRYKVKLADFIEVVSSQ